MRIVQDALYNMGMGSISMENFLYLANGNSSVNVVALENAVGEILAKDVIASSDIPYANMSTVDGFAFRYDDYKNSLISFENRFRMVDILKYVHNGEAVPKYADTVVKKEDTVCLLEKIYIRNGMKPGANIRVKASGARSGEVILERGTLIDNINIGLLGLLGETSIVVYALNRKSHGIYFRPECISSEEESGRRIAIYSTGSEVVSRGTVKKMEQVYDKNSIVLGAILSTTGYIPNYRGMLNDDEEDIVRRCLESLDTFDYIILIGGSSFGARDKTHCAFKKLREKEGFCVSPSSVIKNRPRMCFRGEKVIWSVPGRLMRAIQIVATEILPFLEEKGVGPWENRVKRWRAVSAVLRLESRQSTDACSPFVRIFFDEGGLVATPIPADCEVECLKRVNGIIAWPRNGKFCSNGSRVKVYPVNYIS